MPDHRALKKPVNVAGFGQRHPRRSNLARADSQGRDAAPEQLLCTDIDGFSLRAAERCESHDCRRAGGVEAQDTLVRRHHTS